MPLFIVRHQHPADGCPAEDPLVGAELLIHLSRPNVKKFGLQIHGEAVVQGEHTMYLIVEAEDEHCLRRFMQPFEMAGSLDIYPAATCVRTVANGGCAAPMLPDARVPTLDPEDACQQAIDAGLVVHRVHPLNCETSIPALVGGVVMPNARFYMRNNFRMPYLDAATFRLTVGGVVERPQSFTLRDLQNMRSSTLVATLECAGNGRSLFERPTEGEKWGLGAVSTAEWTGVPLLEILDRAGVRPEVKDVLFRGADGGPVDGRSNGMRFERSLCRDDAGADVLLAYAMNGEPLPVEHGYPLRLIVPGWYAVASVKWLTDIELIDRTFTGHYQGDKYRYEWERDGQSRQRAGDLATRPRADYRAVSRRRGAPRRVGDSRRGLVGSGADCASRSQRQRQRLAGCASRQPTASLQLAMVGAAHARGGLGTARDSCAGHRFGWSHAARAGRVEPPWLREQRHPARADPRVVIRLRRRVCAHLDTLKELCHHRFILSP
jgi:DMSO/TMAO reductase YedYZ molybdopterin-dependent catalytic subunit